jgi:D-aspartate ligase
MADTSGLVEKQMIEKNIRYSQEQAGAVIIGGNFQGLGIVRNLARHKVPVFLLDTGLCMGRFSRHTDKFFKCPDVRQEGAFLDFLMALAKKEDIKGWVIYPNDDETVSFLARHQPELNKYYRFITPPWGITKFAYDKKLTREAALKCGINVPGTIYPSSVEDLNKTDIRFPVIIKPSIKEPFYSRTKKKAIRVDKPEDLAGEYVKAKEFIDASQTLMVQELIPGGTNNLFSVGSLSRDGELLARVVVKRLRQHPMDFGHATTYAQTVDIPELEETAKRILGEIGFYGLSEVEFMLDTRDGKYKLLEINARPWGWHTLAIAAGVNLPYLSYLDALGEKITVEGFTKGIKWFRLTTDLPTIAVEIIKGRMKPGDYFRSLRGKKTEAVLSFNDPLPFLAEMAMLPYLWKTRGF